MKCHHGRSAQEEDDDDEEDDDEAVERPTEEEPGTGGEERARSDKKDLQGPSNARKEPVKHDVSRCTVAAGANAALDLTLNCNSVRLTFRDTSLKAATRGREVRTAGNGPESETPRGFPLESGFCRATGCFCSFKKQGKCHDY